MDLNNEKAIQFYMSIQLLNYGTVDSVNEEILGRLCYFLCPTEDKDDPDLDYFTSELVDAFSRGEVMERFGELLLQEQHFETLILFNMLRGI